MGFARRRWICCFRSLPIRSREARTCCSSWSDSRATPDAPRFIPKSWGGSPTPRAQNPSLVPLSLRRQAEAKARAGDHTEAAKLVDEATAAATLRGDAIGRALCLATAGAIALYRADWAEAERALSEARGSLPDDFADQEELARVEHNFGVVALYRGRPDQARDAFTRSLSTKRRLGDRAGIRACLLNLGITLAKLGELDQADVTLARGGRSRRSAAANGGTWLVLGGARGRGGSAQECSRRGALDRRSRGAR